MLRTTKKEVIRKLEQHVLENFWPHNYGSGTIGLQNLKEQIDALRYNNRSVYQAAIDYMEGGSILVYNDDVRDFLQELLEETDDEANRYSTEKTWRLYCHLCARTIANLYSVRERELEMLAGV